ncbi:arylsulfotransferase [Kipferlia bialata]|uniref:Arylsulfotransferase n=1 Tax=Kipferlia bialata TaxID=797122 RepID=A0A9K3CPF8_9EUKA|nr:arylsulfotransferase [Kipferlia bialata]|eukprot:g1962.t1
MYAGYLITYKDREPEVVKIKDWFRTFQELDVPVPLERAMQPEEHWDVILTFDPNHKLVNVWDSKEHIDMSLEEQEEWSFNNLYFNLDLQAVEAIYYGDVSSDRTHSNTFFYDPRDKNLYISVRNHDSVYKLNWDSGSEVVPQGDPIFNLQNFKFFDRDYNPITKDPENNVYTFSHQHCPVIYEIEGRDDIYVMSLFDNNNTPVMKYGQPENSYAIAMLIHEERQEAVFMFRKALPEFSFAMGSSMALHNGNFFYLSGVHDGLFEGSSLAGAQTSIYEMNPEGEIVYSATGKANCYRGWRLNSLHGSVDYQKIDFRRLPIPEAWNTPL